jgi:hypothetical protein
MINNVTEINSVRKSMNSNVLFDNNGILNQINQNNLMNNSVLTSSQQSNHNYLPQQQQQ